MNHFISRLDPGLEGKSYVKDIFEVIDKMGDNGIYCVALLLNLVKWITVFVYTVTVRIKECDVCNLFSNSSE